MAWQIVLAAPLPLAFLSGSVLWLYRDHVPVSSTTVALSAGFVLASGFTEIAVAITPLAVGILTFWLGQRLPFAGFGSRYDASYGVYIYGWPVQILVILLARRVGIQLPMFVNIVVVLAVVAAFAYASCYLVEHPALTLRKREPWLRDSWHHLAGRRARIIGALTATFLVVGTTAATATGNLPVPMQRAVATFAADRLPFNVPQPDQPTVAKPPGPVESSAPAAAESEPKRSKPTGSSSEGQPGSSSGEAPTAGSSAKPPTELPKKVKPGKPDGPSVPTVEVPDVPQPSLPKPSLPKPTIPAVPELPKKLSGLKPDVQIPPIEQSTQHVDLPLNLDQ
jgi:hypothetical protein